MSATRAFVETTKLKTLRGVTALARFLAECEQDVDPECGAQTIGFIPRQDLGHRYSYCQTDQVYDYGNLPVVVVETSQNRFTVYRVMERDKIAAQEIDAENAYFEGFPN